MTLPLITAVASAISVIVSVVVALITSRAQIKKIRTELRTSYEKFLFDERFKRYPEVYTLMSRYSKEFRYGHADRDTFRQFLKEFDEWDSQYSWLFSDQTSDLAWRVQHSLHLVAKDDHTPLDVDLSLMGQLECCLKAELGALGTDVAGKYQPGSIDLLNKRVKKAQARRQS